MALATSQTLLILGCGYLGLQLAQSARARGWEVKAVSRSQDALAEAAAAGASTFCGLVESSDWHAFAGSDIGIAINCASAGGGGLAGYERSYVRGNRSMGEWASRCDFAGAAFYTSSVSVYPDADGAWIDESNQLPPTTERGRLVQESEAVFRTGFAGRRAFVLRLAGLYGPGRHLLLDSARSGPASLPGWGDYFLNLIRIEDVVSAIWSCHGAASALPLGGTFNVVDDAPALKADMVAWLAQRFGHPAPVFTGVAGGVSSRRLGEDGRPANRRISNRRLRSSTGWSPRFATFREGFADLASFGGE